MNFFLPVIPLVTNFNLYLFSNMETSRKNNEDKE